MSCSAAAVPCGVIEPRIAGDVVAPEPGSTQPSVTSAPVSADW